MSTQNSGKSHLIKEIIKNPNATKEQFDTIANTIKATDMGTAATQTDSKEFINSMLNSSKPFNRNLMFKNPNVNSENLYNLTKTYPNANYGKKNFNLLNNKGYDMSHIEGSLSQKRNKSVPLARPKQNNKAAMIRRGTLNISQSTINQAKQMEKESDRKLTNEKDVDNFITENGGVDSFINKYAQYETTRGSGILSRPQGSYKTVVTDNGDTVRFRNEYGATANFRFNDQDFEVTKNSDGKWSNVKKS